MAPNRRLSVCYSNTMEDRHSRHIVRGIEWICMCCALALWGYTIGEVLRPNNTDHINYFGLTFYKGPTWTLIYQQLVIISIFVCANVAMMLASKHNDFARSICGFQSVHGDQSFPMTILTGIYYTFVVQSTTGLGDLSPRVSLSMLVTLTQVLAGYFLNSQFIYAVFWLTAQRMQ